MTVDGPLAIILLALGAGAVLAVPGLWWARRRARAAPQDAPERAVVTRAGYVFAALCVVILGGAYATRYFLPEIYEEARAVAVAFVVASALVGDRVTTRLGVPLIRKQRNRTNG